MMQKGIVLLFCFQAAVAGMRAAGVRSLFVGVNDFSTVPAVSEPVSLAVSVGALNRIDPCFAGPLPAYLATRYRCIY